MYNPISRIWHSQSPRGVKVIALSLMLVLASAAPIMLYILLGPKDGNPVGLGILFAAGAMLAHLGFVAGMLMLIWDTYIARKK